MIAFVLVMMVSLSTGQTTQAVLEGPMSREWCEQLILQDRYNGVDGVTRRMPRCLSGQEAQQLLAANACTRSPGPSPHWPSIPYDCAPSPAASPAAMVSTTREDAVPVAALAVTPGVPPQRRAAGPADEARDPVPWPAPPLPIVAPAVRGQPPPPAQKQIHLGAAASALVAQALRQSSAGDHAAAASTIERALRIEPDNPLLWIELGQIRMAEGEAGQADGVYRKALALASGDSGIEARAWALIAESLRARGRIQEAADAEARVSRPASY
jgi:tetratricopeptide (TPR) repeat protein